MSFLLAIPAYNEATRIGMVLEGLVDWREHVIVVDDGSTDGTLDVVKHRGFNVLRHDINEGVGRALKTAIQYAFDTGRERLVTLDADGQHDPRFVGSFLHNLERSDFVMGTRHYRVAPTHKAAANLFAALIVNEVFNVRLADVACGYRAFRCARWMLTLPSEGYGFLYEQLTHFLASRDSIVTIEMPALYNPEVLWATRALEIVGLLMALMKFRMSATMRGKLEFVLGAIRRQEDFACEVAGHRFFFFFISREDSYLVQTDIWQATQAIVELGNGGVYIDGA